MGEVAQKKKRAPPASRTSYSRRATRIPTGMTECDACGDRAPTREMKMALCGHIVCPRCDLGTNTTCGPCEGT
jgi:hypothetical protein